MADCPTERSPLISGSIPAGSASVRIARKAAPPRAISAIHGSRPGSCSGSCSGSCPGSCPAFLRTV